MSNKLYARISNRPVNSHLGSVTTVPKSIFRVSEAFGLRFGSTSVDGGPTAWGTARHEKHTSDRINTLELHTQF
jgi:hypothetical protein